MCRQSRTTARDKGGRECRGRSGTCTRQKGAGAQAACGAGRTWHCSLSMQAALLLKWRQLSRAQLE